MDGGKGQRIAGAQETIFQNVVSDERNWDTLGSALDSLVGWYLKGEDAMFIQDVEFLFAGSPSRTQSLADGVTYWTTEPNYDGTLDPQFYNNPSYMTAPQDEDMNVHHWAWGVAIGYNLGQIAGLSLNTGREYQQAGRDLNRVNWSDVHIGNAGVSTGADLWWNPNDISSTMYPYLGMAPR